MNDFLYHDRLKESRDRCLLDVQGWLADFDRRPNIHAMQMVVHWAQHWIRLNTELEKFIAEQKMKSQ